MDDRVDLAEEYIIRSLWECYCVGIDAGFKGLYNDAAYRNVPSYRAGFKDSFL